jgi:hypothetical protein
MARITSRKPTRNVQIDATTSGGERVFHVIAGLAEFQRDLIRERIYGKYAFENERGARRSHAAPAPAGLPLAWRWSPSVCHTKARMGRRPSHNKSHRYANGPVLPTVRETARRPGGGAGASRIVT